MTSHPALAYGTCVALGPIAALLQGPSGSGKSDLALRFITLAPDWGGEAAALVADDQVQLEVCGGKLLAGPPATIAGKMEVRGLGIVEVPFCAEAELRLVVRLCASEDVPRMPDARLPAMEFAGIAVPVIALAPFEASAPLKLRLALRRIGR